MLVPSHVLEHFEIWDAHEYSERWVIEMREKAGKIPPALINYSDIVFDGYTNPVETLSYSFVCKPVWLKPVPSALQAFSYRYSLLQRI